MNIISNIGKSNVCKVNFFLQEELVKVTAGLETLALLSEVVEQLHPAVSPGMVLNPKRIGVKYFLIV